MTNSAHHRAQETPRPSNSFEHKKHEPYVNRPSADPPSPKSAIERHGQQILELWERERGSTRQIGRALGLSHAHVHMISRALRCRGVPLHDYHGESRAERLEARRLRALGHLEREFANHRQTVQRADISERLRRQSNPDTPVSSAAKILLARAAVIVYPAMISHAQQTLDDVWIGRVIGACGKYGHRDFQALLKSTATPQYNPQPHLEQPKPSRRNRLPTERRKTTSANQEIQ